MAVRPLSAFPRSAWKKYAVHLSNSWYGYPLIVEAPNKTYARLFARGELRPGAIIKSIEEVKQ